MKSRVAVLPFLAWLLIPALMTAQNQPSPEKTDPLFLIKIAADVAGNVQQSSLEGYLAVYVSEQNWADGLKDGDLGPFLQLKDAKPGRSVVFFLHNTQDGVVCVYFDGKSPFGVLVFPSGLGRGHQASDLQAAYKPVSKEMLKKGEQEWKFTSGEVNTDAGVALPAFKMAK